MVVFQSRWLCTRNQRCRPVAVLTSAVPSTISAILAGTSFATVRAKPSWRTVTNAKSRANKSCDPLDYQIGKFAMGTMVLTIAPLEQNWGSLCSSQRGTTPNNILHWSSDDHPRHTSLHLCKSCCTAVCHCNPPLPTLEHTGKTRQWHWQHIYRYLSSSSYMGIDRDLPTKMDDTDISFYVRSRG